MSQDNSPTSTVSTLASRFSAPPTTEADGAPSVSDKLSGIANKFGATIDQKPPPKQHGKPRKVLVEPPAPTPRVVAETPASVSEVAKRFANTNIAQTEGDGHDEEEASVFASAHNRFRKAEEAARAPVESRVSAFAKRIDSGKNSSADMEADREAAGTAPSAVAKGAVPADSEADGAAAARAAAGIGDVLSRFESGTVEKSRDEGIQEEQVESAGSRFENASKLFTDGEKSAVKADADDEEQPETAGSRFAQAARMFNAS